MQPTEADLLHAGAFLAHRGHFVVVWIDETGRAVQRFGPLAEFVPPGVPICPMRPYFLTEHDCYHAPNGCLTADLIQKPIDAQVEAGMIPATIDAAAVLDLSYLPGSCA